MTLFPNTLLETDGIYIVPAQLAQDAIENRAFKYLLTYLGDAITLQSTPLSDSKGWELYVYGTGLSQPLGKLVYSPSGILSVNESTPLRELRQAARNAAQNPIQP